VAPRVPVRRIVAASDVAAGLAEPKVHRLATRPEAVLAAVGGGRWWTQVRGKVVAWRAQTPSLPRPSRLRAVGACGALRLRARAGALSHDERPVTPTGVSRPHTPSVRSIPTERAAESSNGRWGITGVAPFTERSAPSGAPWPSPSLRSHPRGPSMWSAAARARAIRGRSPLRATLAALEVSHDVRERRHAEPRDATAR
jgi:hypothetical protein